MCGANTKLWKTMIEGTQMNVCRDCSKFGKILSAVRPEPVKSKSETRKPLPQGPEIIQVISEDYAKKIRLAREQLNLTQKEFAQKINEKESIIHKLETSSFEPNMALARKLEKALKITLVEQHEESEQKTEKTESGEEFTLGDFIKIKKKKS